jgi:phage tail sheath protein FI
MPEYLAPGVYVEEIEIGAKPIEGVSTTTTGFLGMAERGDLNKPTLVTSFAEYQRIFGGYLAEKVYGNKRGLPYAVEGFFVNGGQRLYVSRVATENAVKSSGFLPDISGKSISLAEEVKAKAITLKVKEGATGLKKDDVLLLKDGPQSEYLKFVSTAKALTLDVPLNQSYAKDTEIKKMKQGTTAATTYTIQEDMAANVVVIKLDKVTGLGENDVLLINDPTNSEICIVESVGTTEEKSIEVKTPLRFAHAKNVEIKKLTTTATTKELISVVKAGYTDVPITATDTDFSPDDAIKIGDEYFIIRAAEADKVILIADELKHPHKMDEEIKQLVPAIEVKAVNEGTWGDKIKIVVNESTSSSAKLAADALNQNFLDLDTVTGMEKGTLLKLHTTNQDG